jgi:hypothetical protein
MRRPNRCPKTGLSCSTSYMRDGCRCPGCQRWQRDRLAAQRRNQAPRAPRGTIIAQGPEPVSVPDRPARAPVPVRPLSPGLLAAHGFGGAVAGVQGATRAPGKVTARSDVDVQLLRAPRGTVPELACNGCGSTWVRTVRFGAPACPSCGATEGLRVSAWVSTAAARPPAPELAATKPRRSGASDWRRPGLLGLLVQR